jgi:hypothetical protein
MAISTSAQQQADAEPDLELIATTSDFSATVNENGTAGVQTRGWKIYLVKHSAMVEPLTNYPAVMTKVPKGGREWQNAAEDAYLAPNHDVLYAASGPKSWPRVAGPIDKPPTKRVLGTSKVSHIRATDDRISFDVSKTGVPVVVKASYFPNWQASGAQGPWRVTPNEMVVIPTSTHVSLHYGWTPVDWFGNFATLLGLLGLIVLWRRSPRGDGDGEDVEDFRPTDTEAIEDFDHDAWLKELTGVP